MAAVGSGYEFNKLRVNYRKKATVKNALILIYMLGLDIPKSVEELHELAKANSHAKRGRPKKTPPSSPEVDQLATSISNIGV